MPIIHAYPKYLYMSLNMSMPMSLCSASQGATKTRGNKQVANL